MASATLPKIKPGKFSSAANGLMLASGKTFATTNPATGEMLTMLADAGEHDAAAAVNAARTAYTSGPWAEMAAADRAKILWKIGDLVDKYVEEIATLETLDNGKPIFESRQVDMPMVAEVFRYFAGWATKIIGETFSRTRPIFKLHVARTNRSRRCNHSLEFSAASRVVENCPGTRRRKHRRPEARATHFAFRAAPR